MMGFEEDAPRFVLPVKEGEALPEARLWELKQACDNCFKPKAVSTFELFGTPPEARKKRLDAEQKESADTSTATTAETGTTANNKENNNNDDKDTQSNKKPKKTVLFGLPGAFTPTCTTQHLPGYVALADEFADLGYELVCVSVNDPYVMRHWGEMVGCDDKVRLMSDGNCEFTSAIGLVMDKIAQGMGLRSQRYAMVVVDGVVKHLSVELPGVFEVSSARTMLEAVKALDKKQ